jgi:hypothetical protein
MGRYFSLSTGEKVRVRTWPVILTPSAAFGAPYNDYLSFTKRRRAGMISAGNGLKED